MPRATAAPTTRSASCAVGATPNVAVPRQIRETFTPVLPRTEYFISEFLFLRSGVVGESAETPAQGEWRFGQLLRSHDGGRESDCCRHVPRGCSRHADRDSPALETNPNRMVGFRQPSMRRQASCRAALAPRPG